MPSQIAHLRNLAKYGVITDIDPYDLAPEAFSAGVNIRFRNGKISGAPVFRNVLHLGNTSPRFTFSSNPTSGLDFLFVGYLNGTVSRIGSTETAYSVSGYTPVSAEATWSSTTLANVTYVNRSDRAPWFLRTSDTQFQTIAGLGALTADKWDATWSCRLLRTCGGALVALNVSKGGTNFPQMVKTSSIPTAGAIPASWDQTQANTLATENTIADIDGAIVDACRLGEELIIYGAKEARRMSPNGQLSEFNIVPLPFKRGAINTNCSVELAGKNIVFGPDDIYEHDGISDKSIAEGRVKDYIYASINMALASRCFVEHNPKLTEIAFNYVSGDNLVAFNGVGGCNKAAVWNYTDNTWTFDDRPSVYSACSANLSNPVTFTTVVGTFDTFGGSFQDQEDGFKRTACYVGDSASAYGLTASLYGFDVYGQGSTVAFPVDTNATKPRYLERDGIDLDEVGAELRGQKTLVSIYPQIRLGVGAAPIYIDGGSAEGFNEGAVFVGQQPYDGVVNTKCDFNASGRYLSIRVYHNDYKELSVAGLDMEFSLTAKRG